MQKQTLVLETGVYPIERILHPSLCSVPLLSPPEQIEQLIREWISLVTERDQLLREEIEKVSDHKCSCKLFWTC